MPQLPPTVISSNPSHPAHEPVHELTFWQHKWAQKILPLATSLAVHLGILIVGLIILGATHFILKAPFATEITIPEVTMNQDDKLGGPSTTGTGTDFIRQAAQEIDFTTSKGISQTKDRDLNHQLQGGGGDAGDIIALGDGRGPGHGDGTGGGLASGLGIGDGGGPEAPFGPKSTGGPSGPGIGLFPQNPNSNITSVCYICDGSGSLFGGKDQALCSELKKTVDRLSPIQAFNVFIFQEGPASKQFLSLGSKLLMANHNNISQLDDLIDNKLTFHGATNPIPALEEAWRENPQLVYLLTDGEFDNPDSATVMARIKDLNDARKRQGLPIVKVNTILLVEKRNESYPAFESLMKKIADDNGGIYKKSAAEDLE